MSSGCRTRHRGSSRPRMARFELMFDTGLMATPDNLLASALHGTAWRAVAERGSLEWAVAEPRALARGRDDLLAETAGITAGSWLAWPEVRGGHELVVAGLLIMAAGPPGPHPPA